jgi:hypothetical protein
MVSTALIAAGYRTGCYTSPHLVRIEERFTIDGVAVPAPALEEVIEQLRGLADRLHAGGRLQATPTFFEVATAPVRPPPGRKWPSRSGDGGRPRRRTAACRRHHEYRLTTAAWRSLAGSRSRRPGSPSRDASSAGGPRRRA